jgi:7-alpha-hydroxysteroid dehydrogenase
MLDDLKGKTIFITGSSRGIGFATAQLLQSLSAIVILNSHNEQELMQASSKLNNTAYFVADMSKDDQVKRMCEEILAEFGHIDGLVNNVGGGGWGSVNDPDSEWQKSFDLDIMASVRTCRYLLPKMKENGGGAVVNISSLWGVDGTAKPSIASYCVAKAGITKLTEILAQQYSPQIRVNTVAPGWTKTAMMEDFTPDQLKFMESNTLLRRLAEPSEIAQVIVFLLSQASSYITGQIIPADGGYLLTRSHPQS